MAQMGDNGDQFGGVNPILRVSSLKKSVNYYVTRLGFKVEWRTPLVVCVSRGRCQLFLSEGDQGHFGTWVWIGVPNVQHIFQEYEASGAIVRQPPTNFPWALEIQIADPDGNVLRLGSDPLENVPYGPWLDMNGQQHQFHQ